MSVLITGIGSGIGKATALHFLNMGYTVIGVLRNQAHHDSLMRDVGEYKKNLSIIYSDLESPEFSDKVLDGIRKLKVSKLSCVINVAGVLDTSGYEAYDFSKISKVMTVNFISPALLISKLTPFLMASEKSNVVNITSMSGFQGSVRFPGLGIYGASKAALGSLSESLSVEFENTGIHVNALAIGSVNTAMLRNAFPDYAAAISAEEMGSYIFNFATLGYKFHNGKVLSVAITNP